MNRTLLLIFIFLILAGGAYWLINAQDQSSSTVASSEVDFAIPNTDEIYKIFVVDRTGNPPITVERKSDYWMLNGVHKARQNSVDLLLDFFRGVELRNVPPNAALPSIIRSFASNGIKVEAYDKNGKKLKSLIVGGVTNNESGTYLIMEGSNNPYVCHIPSFQGSLRTRFVKLPEEWRDRAILEYPYESVKRISVEYPKQKNKSFVLKKEEDSFSVNPFYEITKAKTQKPNQAKIERYIINYEKVYGEAFENQHPKKDEILATIPFCKIEVETQKGETRKYNFYPHLRVSAEGKILPVPEGVEIERYLLDVNGEDFMLVQDLSFNKVFWAYDSFFD